MPFCKTISRCEKTPASFSVRRVFIENGDDMKTVQTNLGHATASFTLDVYGHVSQWMHQQSAKRMERFIQSDTG